MAKNRHSAGCGPAGCLDKAIKKRNFPSFGAAALRTFRGVVSNPDNFVTYNGELISFNSLVKEFIPSATDDFDWQKRFDELEDRMSEALLHRETFVPTENDEEFMSAYTKALQVFREDTLFKDRVKDFLNKRGYTGSSHAAVYKAFKTHLGNLNCDRRELLSQVVAACIHTLDDMEEQNPTKTRAELIQEANDSDAPLFTRVRRKLQENFIANDRLFRATNNEEYKRICKVLNSIVGNKAKPEVFTAITYMAKQMLLDAEKIKINDKIDFSYYMEEDERETVDKDAEVKEAETQGAEHWQLKSDTILTFASLTKEARSILYKLEQDGSAGILGFNRIVDTMKIHCELIALRKKYNCQTSEEFLKAISKVDEPWGKQLYNILATSKNRSNFFNCYRRNNLNYVDHSYYLSDGKARVYRETNTVSKELLFNTYLSNTIDIDSPTLCIFDTQGTIDVSKRNNFLAQFNIDGFITNPGNTTSFNFEVLAKNEYSRKITDRRFEDLAPSEQERLIAEAKRDFVYTVNYSLNLKLNGNDIDLLLANSAKLNSFLFYAHRFAEAVGRKGQNVSNLDKLFKNASILGYFKNMLSRSKSTVSAGSSSTIVESTFRYQGSTYATSTIPCSLGDNLERMAKAASEGRSALRSYLEETYLKCPVFATFANGEYIVHHPLLRAIYEATDEDLKKPTSPVNMLVNNLTRGLGSKQKEFENFMYKDNTLFSMFEFSSIMESTGGKSCTIPLFVTGDSNAGRYLTVPFLNEETAREAMADLVVSELKRMEMFSSVLDFFDKNNIKINNAHAGRTVAEWREYIEKNPNKTKGVPGIVKYADAFTSFPELHDFTITVGGRQVNAAKHLIEEWKKVKEEKDENKMIEAMNSFKKDLESILLDFLDDQFRNKFLKDLVNKGIAKKNGKDILLDEKVFSVPDGLKDSVKEADRVVENNKFLRNYFLNYKVNMAQELQLLTIDPGYYENVNDLQKRFKENIASGTPLDLTALDPSDMTKYVDDRNGYQYSIITDEIFIGMGRGTATSESEDVEFTAALENSGYYDMEGSDGKSSIKKYVNGNTLTDGQGWRSFTSYRKILTMQGVWNDNMEKVYQIIMDHRRKYANQEKKVREGKLKREDAKLTERLTLKELKKIAALKVVFQPLKPFYYGFESIELNGGKNKALLPVQCKYSELPVIPELLPKGCKLGELGKAMDSYIVGNDPTSGKQITGLDLVVCGTCVKVGGYGNTSIAECKTADDISSAFSRGRIHAWHLNGYRIQNSVPEHSNTLRARGTQVIKHGLMCLAETSGKRFYRFMDRLAKKSGVKSIKLTDTEDLEFGDEGLDAKGLMKLYNGLCSVGFIKSSLKFINRFSTTESISNTLTALRMNDSRAADDTVLGYELTDEGNLMVPPCEGIAGEDNLASVLSIVRNSIIKQPFMGGSLVQTSALGFEDVLKVEVSKEKDNVIVADCGRVFDYTVNVDGKEVELDFFEYVDNDSGQLLGVNDELVEPALPVEGDSEKSYYGWNTKLGHDYPGILDMIAYRIPTEKAYSIINLRPKRFWHKTAGATIMVPAQFTTVAGFDFDIDKLYFFRREVKFAIPDSKDPKYAEVWADIYGLKKREDSETGESYLDNSNGTGIYKALKKTRKKAQKEFKEDLRQKIKEEGGDPNDVDYLFYETTGMSVRPGKDSDKEVKFSKGDIKYSEESEDIDPDTVKEDKQDNPFKKRLNEFWDEAVIEINGETRKLSEVYGSVKDYFAKMAISKGYVKVLSDYDNTKTLIGNSQTQINNLLFDLYQARLEDKDTLPERYIMGGFAGLASQKKTMLAIQYGELDTWHKLYTKAVSEGKGYDRALEEIAKDYEEFTPKYSPTDPETVTHYQVMNALYDKLIGVAANQNINQRLTAVVEKMLLNDPVLFGSMVERARIDGKVGRDIKTRNLGNVDTELSVTEYLAAAVDAVKDALLEFYGIDENNFNVVCLLSKIGASPRDIGLLMNQPIVRKASEILKDSDYVKSLSSALNSAIETLVPDNTEHKAALRERIEEYRNKVLEEKSSHEEISRHDDLTTDKLVFSLFLDSLNNLEGNLEEEARKKGINAEDLKEFFDASGNVLRDDFRDKLIDTQISVLSLLTDAISAASELNDQIRVSKNSSTKAVSSSAGGIQVLKQTARVLSENFGNSDRGSMFSVVVSEDLPVDRRTWVINPNLRFDYRNAEAFMTEILKSPYAIEQAAYSSIMSVTEQSLSDLFPEFGTVYEDAANYMAKLTRKGILSEDLFNMHNKDFTLFLMGKMVEGLGINDLATFVLPSDFVGEAHQTINTGMPNGIFYTKYFPEFLKRTLMVNQARVEDAQKNPDKYKGKEVIDYSKIAILAALDFETYKNFKTGKRVDSIIMRNIGGLQKEQKNSLIESWEFMLNSGDPILEDLAYHLFKYSFFTNGFKFGPKSVMNFTPTSLKIQLCEGDYVKFFNRIFNLRSKPGNAYVLGESKEGNVPMENGDYNIRIKDYIKSFILHEFKNNIYQLATEIPTQLSKNLNARSRNADAMSAYDLIWIQNPGMREGKFDRSFTISLKDSDIKSYVKNKIASTKMKKGENGKNEVAGYIFTPCLYMKDGNGNYAVYICDSSPSSSDVVFNTSSVNNINGGSITYTRMELPLCNTDWGDPSTVKDDSLLTEEERIQKEAMDEVREAFDTLFLNEKDKGWEQSEEPDSNNFFGVETYIPGNVSSILQAWMSALGNTFGVSISNIRTLNVDPVQHGTVRELTEFASAFTDPNEDMIVYDFETTGTNIGKDDIVLIGASRVNSKGEILESFSVLVQSDKADEIKDLFDRTAYSGKKIKIDNPIYKKYREAIAHDQSAPKDAEKLIVSKLEAYERFFEFIGKSKYTIGHNSEKFDHLILVENIKRLKDIEGVDLERVKAIRQRLDEIFSQEHTNKGIDKFGELKRFDTITLARMLYEKSMTVADDLKDLVATPFTLQNLIHSLGLDSAEGVVNSHDAADDVIATAALAKKISDEIVLRIENGNLFAGLLPVLSFLYTANVAIEQNLVSLGEDSLGQTIWGFDPQALNGLKKDFQKFLDSLETLGIEAINEDRINRTVELFNLALQTSLELTLTSLEEKLNKKADSLDELNEQDICRWTPKSKR